MRKQAMILLNEGSMTSGVVDNIIEIAAEAAIGLHLPDNHILWDCGQYPVAIGDEWNDGVFTREGEPLTPIPTAEQQITDLQAQLDALLLGGESVCFKYASYDDQ